MCRRMETGVNKVEYIYIYIYIYIYLFVLNITLYLYYNNSVQTVDRQAGRLIEMDARQMVLETDR